MFAKLRDAQVARRKTEEAYYEAAIAEFESGCVRQGLMGQALASSDGDERKAHATYIRLLATAIRDDAYIAMRNNEARAVAEAESECSADHSRDHEDIPSISTSKPSDEVSWRKLASGVITWLAVGLIFISLLVSE
jgi:hypothetical protein